jgi:predicted transcriptional regulator
VNVQEAAVSDPAPSERELEILKVLWDLGEASVREVHERLAPHDEVHFNTVQTLLRIMEDKGLVRHRAQGRTFIYAPCHGRDQVTRRFLHKVFDGALNQLVLSLLQAEDSSAAELRELERLIVKARKERQARDEEGT